MMIQNDSDILSRIGVASPCSVDWDSMTGDERTRFCQQCTKHVYNLSEMSKKEAEQLVLQSEGKTCIRFYLRKDGTIMTEDCPVGLRLIKAGVKAGMRKVSVAVAAVASLLFSIFPGLGIADLRLGRQSKPWRRRSDSGWKRRFGKGRARAQSSPARSI